MNDIGRIKDQIAKLEITIVGMERMYDAGSATHKQVLKIQLDNDTEILNKCKDELVRLEIEKEKFGDLDLKEIDHDGLEDDLKLHIERLEKEVENMMKLRTEQFNMEAVKISSSPKKALASSSGVNDIENILIRSRGVLFFVFYG